MNEIHNFTFLKQIEEQYHNENMLMRAVTHGQLSLVEDLLTAVQQNNFSQQNTASIRDLKNQAITANTLLRKAAEYGMVHPSQLHKSSEQFLQEIEFAATEKAIFSILKNMAFKYTSLVKNQSLKGYSPIVRKVLIQITSDLSVDLSLKNLAALLHVNPSYLSTIFKQETGYTLTQYVTAKRMELAKDLLCSTSLLVQDIALQCGIHDICYFTKLFKNHTGQAPTEYRREHANLIQEESGV